MEQSTVTPIAERRTALDLAFRVLNARKDFIAGYNQVACNNEPQLLTIEKEGSALQGQQVYLLNTNAATAQQRAEAQRLLNLALSAYEAGDVETAERFATDAINQSVVVRLNANASYIPQKGEIFSAYGEMDENGIVRAKANSAKPLESVATKTVRLSSSMQERLEKLGILKPSASATPASPASPQGGKDDDNAPL